MERKELYMQTFHESLLRKFSFQCGVRAIILNLARRFVEKEEKTEP